MWKSRQHPPSPQGSPRVPKGPRRGPHSFTRRRGPRSPPVSHRPSSRSPPGPSPWRSQRARDTSSPSPRDGSASVNGNVWKGMGDIRRMGWTKKKDVNMMGFLEINHMFSCSWLQKTSSLRSNDMPSQPGHVRQGAEDRHKPVPRCRWRDRRGWRTVPWSWHSTRRRSSGNLNNDPYPWTGSGIPEDMSNKHMNKELGTWSQTDIRKSRNMKKPPTKLEDMSYFPAAVRDRGMNDGRGIKPPWVVENERGQTSPAQNKKQIQPQFNLQFRASRHLWKFYLKNWWPGIASSQFLSS